MEIKRATLKDSKPIAEIFRIESSKPPYNKKRTSEKALKKIKEDFRGNNVYIAIENNKIVGFAMVSVDSGIKNQLWINEIWLLKDYQGKGVGKKLMVEIEKIYKKKGINVFELVTDTRKGGAHSFYKKLGYKEDHDMVFMQKKF